MISDFEATVISFNREQRRAKERTKKKGKQIAENAQTDMAFWARGAKGFRKR